MKPGATKVVQRRLDRCRLVVCSGLFAALVSCQSTPGISPSPPAHTVVDPIEAPGASGLLPADLDPTSDPQQDFYAYANGGWLAANPIPHGASRWSAGSELRQRIGQQLELLLEGLNATELSRMGPEARRLATFYQSGMNLAAVEMSAARSLEQLSVTIDGLRDVADFPAVLGALHRRGLPVLFNIDVDVDLRGTGLSRLWLTQGGLGLPLPAMYQPETAGGRKTWRSYLDHIDRVHHLIGSVEATKRAEAVLAISGIESALAGASLGPQALRNPAVYDRLVTLEQLDAATPGFSWSSYFAALGHEAPEHVNLPMPEFFRVATQLMRSHSIEAWREYFKSSVARALAPVAGDALEAEWIAFEHGVLRGQAGRASRRERVREVMTAVLGDALGRAYVQSHFSATAQRKARTMAANIRQSLRRRVAAGQWLQPTTRAQALRKLDALVVHIGYPDRWRDDTQLELKVDDYAGNFLRASALAIRDKLERIGVAPDPGRWASPPHVVNGYYDPLQNFVVMPAAFLQPPFFSPDYDDAVNYGGVGSVIAHEMSHALDDAGSRFDATGALRDWWSGDDRRHFEQRTGVLVDHYGRLEIAPGLKVDGLRTLSENIADVQGVRTAYDAMRAVLGEAAGVEVDEWDADQRFFLAYARVWRQNITPEALALQLASDSHAPARARVLGPLTLMPEFWAAFVGAGSGSAARVAIEFAGVW